VLLDPKNYVAWNSLGVVARKMNKTDDAMLLGAVSQALEEVATGNPPRR